jgi:putative ABC transport system permease protein
VQSGRYLQPGDTATALPVRAFADYYHLKPGDGLQIYTSNGIEPLTVAGAVASPEYLILAASKQDLLASASRFGVLFVPEPELERLFGRDGQINDVGVVVTDESQREETISAVTAALASYGVKSVTRSGDQPSRAATKLDLDGAKQFALLLPALILAVAAMAIYIAMSRIVRAQRMIIGLFRALGYGTREIISHYLLISGLTAAAGSLAGIALGYGLSYVMTNAYASTLHIPLVTHAFQPWPVVISAVIGIVVALAAAALPAWTAARMLPAPAMRPAPETSLGRGAALPLERFLWAGRRPPMLVRLSLRNVWRSPSRTAYTVGAVALALLLLLVGFSTFDSMNFTVDEQFGRIDRWDAAVMFSAPQSAGTLDTVLSTSGVASAEPVYLAAAEATSGGRTAQIELTALSPGQRLHGFNLPGGADGNALLRNGGVVLTSGVARSLHVRRGNVVDVKAGERTARLTVAGVSDEPLGGRAYVSMDMKDGELGLPSGFNGLLIETQSAAANPSIQADLYKLPDVGGVQLLDQMRHDWQDVMGLFNVMIWFVVAFCLVMAAAITFNTTTVNVLDREREIGTLRTIGAGPSLVAGTLLLEGFVLSVLSIAPGLIAGTFASSLLTTSFQSEFFSMLFHVRVLTYVIVTALVLAATIVSTLPAIRRCERLDLTEATKTLS